MGGYTTEQEVSFEFTSSSITDGSGTGSLNQTQGSGEGSGASLNSSSSSFNQRRKRSESIGGIKSTAGNITRIVKKSSSNFLKKFVKTFDDKDAPPTPSIPTEPTQTASYTLARPPKVTREVSMPDLPTLTSKPFTEGGRLGPLDTPPPLSPLLDQDLAHQFSTNDSSLWPRPNATQYQNLSPPPPPIGLNTDSWFRDTESDEPVTPSEPNGFSVAGLRDSLTLIPRNAALLGRGRSDEIDSHGHSHGDGDDDEVEDEDEDEDMPANISNRLSKLYEAGSIHMNQSQTSLYYSTKSNLSDSDAAELASRRASMAQDPLGYSLGLSRGNSIRFSQYSLASLHMAPLSGSHSTPTTPGNTRNAMEIPEGRATPRRPVSMFLTLSSGMDADDDNEDHIEDLISQSETPTLNRSASGTPSSSTSTLRGNFGSKETLRTTITRPATICIGAEDANKISSPSTPVHMTPDSHLDDQQGEVAAARNAKRCFEEDELFKKKDQIAEYLGTPKPFNRLVLVNYMNFFDFDGMRLDVAFRTLCQKLVLKGETQEVDRILEVFAGRYVTCNPRTLLGGADHAKDVVHAITYSILLLNTDLHIVQQSTKMSRSAFVKNTLQVVQAQAQQAIQNQYHDDSGSLMGAVSTLGMTRTTTGDSLTEGSPVGSKGRTPSVKSWKSGQSNQSHGFNNYHPGNSGGSKMGSDSKANSGFGNGKLWTQELEILLKEMFTSVKQNQILLPISPATISPPPRSKSNTLLTSPPGSPITTGFGSSIFNSNRMSRLIYPSSSNHDAVGGFGLGSSGRRNSVTTRTKQLRNDAIQRLNALAQTQAIMESDQVSVNSSLNIRHSVAGSLLNEWTVLEMTNPKEGDYTKSALGSRDLSSMRAGSDYSQNSSSSRLSNFTMTASPTAASTATSMTTPSTSQNSLVSLQSHMATCMAPGQEDYTNLHVQSQHGIDPQQKEQLHQQHILSRYRMEGILWRKHLLERTDKKAPNRAWRQLLVVVDIDQGTLSMFRSNGKLPKPSSSSSSTNSNINHNNGQSISSSSTTSQILDFDADMPLFDEIPLQHTITNILPSPGYSSSRRHVFAVQLFTGAVYLFQTSSPRDCEAWARTCNYWAARTSKEPLIGGVVNMEYGWGRALEDNIRQEEERLQSISALENDCVNGSLTSLNSPLDTNGSMKGNMDYLNDPPEYLRGGSDPSARSRSASIRSGTRGSVSSGSGMTMGPGSPGDGLMLFEWTEPMAAMNPSNLSEEDQMLALRKYVAGLEADMEVHQEYRGPMMRLFSPKSSNYAKAFNNWERRSRHLLKEMVKYQIYVECLEQSIQYQQQLDKALQEQQLEFQIDAQQIQGQQQQQHMSHRHNSNGPLGDLEAELAELVVRERLI
ncbi:hypothetical protein BGZ76_008636 [Entomortierella beljakovae]|nr:hypothetical protein BGZ76_008636 [Entomortierella beljakovae]